MQLLANKYGKKFTLRVVERFYVQFNEFNWL